MQQSQSETLYLLRGLTRAYGRGETAVEALSDVDLEIAQGEFLVIAGPSGSGKSTLLQLMGALDRPTGGSIEFEGRDLSRLADRQLAELRRETLGFVFQQFNLIPTLSARQNVEIALGPAGVGTRERRRRAVELLERVGLHERAGHLPSQLSGGEQQRVAIARALSNEPDVLLADEPTGNLDTRTGDSIINLLRRLWEETGVTIVLITHDQEIASRAPRVLRLSDGRLAAADGDRSAAVAPSPAAPRPAAGRAISERLEFEPMGDHTRLVTLDGDVVGRLVQDPGSGQWSYEWRGAWRPGSEHLDGADTEEAERWAAEQIGSRLAAEPGASGPEAR